MGTLTQTHAELQSNIDWHISKASGSGIKVDPAAPTFPWRDIIGAVTPDPTQPTISPTLTAFTTNVKAYAFDNNDLVHFVFHIPHDYVPGSDLYFHIHYGHNGTAVDATTFDSSLYIAYATRDTGVFSEVTTAGFSIDMDTAVQYQHYVEEIQISATSPAANQVDSDDIEVDGLLIATLKVTQIPGITGGSTEPFIFTADLHYQSTGIGTKNSASPFYT